MPVDVVVMAAGKGTRMKSRVPKVLQRLAGVPLVQHVLNTAAQLHARSAVVITGHGADQVEPLLLAPGHPLAAHDVITYSEPVKNLPTLGARLREADIVVLTQQRTRFPGTLITQLPRLTFISQTGRNTGHVDIAACSERGIVVSAKQ